MTSVATKMDRLGVSRPRGSLTPMKPLALLVGVGAIGMLGGCASTSPDAHDARERAITFHRALDSGDYQAACGLLAPETLLELEDEADTACPDALAALDLAPGGGPIHATAYGLAAQVALAGDTVFLTHTPSGWLITAAGCAPVPDKPYDCEVKGE